METEKKADLDIIKKFLNNQQCSERDLLCLEVQEALPGYMGRELKNGKALLDFVSRPLFFSFEIKRFYDLEKNVFIPVLSLLISLTD